MLFPGILADGSLIATAASIRTSLGLDTDDSVTFVGLILNGAQSGAANNTVTGSQLQICSAAFCGRQKDGNVGISGLSFPFQLIGNSVPVELYTIGANSLTLGTNSTADVTIASGGLMSTKSIQPVTDDTYYLGRNDDDSPKAWKGLILKDQSNGKYYRIEMVSGVLTATDLTD